MAEVQPDVSQVPTIAELVEKSTAKSGVPLKVQDTAVVDALRLLVNEARQSQQDQG